MTLEMLMGGELYQNWDCERRCLRATTVMCLVCILCISF